jgi:anti-sigma regulatory factor (Ser/Thr protein kinase)
VRASAEGGWFTVELIYPGVHFDPSDAPEPVLDGSKEGGFGISIIKKCVDEVAYTLQGEQNLLTLRKRANV